MNIEKRPGWDWSVTYQFADEPVESMLVFGCARIEDAITEARMSFDEEDQPELAILAAERQPTS